MADSPVDPVPVPPGALSFRFEEYAFIAVAVLTLLMFAFLTREAQQQTRLVRATPSAELIQFCGNEPAQATARVQLFLEERKLYLASTVLYDGMIRKTCGFLIGSVLAMIGALILFRESKQSPIDLEATGAKDFKVNLTSPGLFLALLGTAIVMTTLLVRDAMDLDWGRANAGETASVDGVVAPDLSGKALTPAQPGTPPVSPALPARTPAAAPTAKVQGPGQATARWPALPKERP